MNQLTVTTPSQSQIIADQRAVPLLCVSLLATAELVLQSGAATLGVIAHCAILLWLLLQAAINSNDKVRVFCITLALMPATRLVSAGLTLAVFGPLVEEVIIEAAWLIATLQVIRYLGLNRVQLGLRAIKRAELVYPTVIVAALLFGLASYTWLQPRLVVELLAFPIAMLASVLASVVAGLEVMVFCGLLLRASRPLVGEVASIVFVALVWGIFRFGTFPLSYATMSAVEGLWLAWLTSRTRSIGPAILAHAITMIVFYGVAALIG